MRRNGVYLTLLFLLVLMTAAPAALAQEARTVVIENGRVFVNGQPLNDSAVPPSLSAFEGKVSFSFSGDEDPLFGFGDHLYRLENERVVEVDRRAAFGGANIHGGVLRNGPHVGVLHSGFHIPAFDSSDFSFELPELDLEWMDSIAVMAESLAVVNVAVARQHSERMQELAREMMHSIPPPGGRVQVFHVPPTEDGGPDGRGFVDSDLIREQIRAERALDEESRRIAEEIRRETSASLRAALEEELRTHLEEVFELRQENRRKEMRELETRLEELHERLERREALRRRIIEERLEFLLREEADRANRN